MTTFEKYMQSEHTGKENAIKSKALESIFGCKGKDIRHMVNELRAWVSPYAPALTDTTTPQMRWRFKKLWTILLGEPTESRPPTMA